MFNSLLAALRTIPDHRTGKNVLYQLEYILLFVILAIAANAKGYVAIEHFIAAHRRQLNELFGLTWGRAPDHTCIRSILLNLDQDGLERAFRDHAKELAADGLPGRSVVAIDGKELRGSFDRFAETPALRLVSAFLVDRRLILGHAEVDPKSNEIPAVQQLLQALGISGKVITVDALHCQKNL